MPFVGAGLPAEGSSWWADRRAQRMRGFTRWPEAKARWPSARLSWSVPSPTKAHPRSRAWPRESSRPAHSARKEPWTARAGAAAIWAATQPARSRSSGAAADLRDEPDLVGPGGRHALGIAEEGDPQDLAEGHLGQQVQWFVAGGHAVADVGVEEGGVLGRHDDVHLAQHVEGPAAGHAVDGGHHRLPQVVGLGPDVLTGVIEHERRGA